jgi:citrate lyase beta subunit
MSIGTTLPSSYLDRIASALAGSPARTAPIRPVHVLYGGAHLFDAGALAKVGARARSAMEQWGADAIAFARAVGLPDLALAPDLADRVRTKLERRPVEAMCIDFEDGYGPRTDAEEDAEAVRTGAELANLAAKGTAVGIRIKALAGETALRGLRTLDLFLTSFSKHAVDGLRRDFSVTLPKVTSRRQVTVLADALERLESSLGIDHVIAIELMVESPATLLGPWGPAIGPLVEASRHRCSTLHLGAYDFTAELGVTAVDQRLDHPYCDLARMLLKAETIGTALGVSDGATTILPIAKKGASTAESLPDIHRAWSIHAKNVRRAIELGIWQGWDLHPAQLPARYGALFGYFVEHRAEMARRLRAFVERATQASRVGQIFDDAATGQGLVSFFARGIACGALDETDLRETSLDVEELSMPFAEIAERRRNETP